VFRFGVSVQDFTCNGNSVTAVTTATGEEIASRGVVLAAGSWTPRLARRLGIRLFIQPGKGYGVNVADPPVDLSTPVILSEEKVAITPYPGRLRVVGTVEAGGFSNRIRRQRFEGIFESLPKYFPELQPQAPPDSHVWHGFRSLSADGLPYIGRYPSYSNLTIATGHSMFGMSSGPATGLIVSQLVAGKEPSIDIAAFAVDR
jgi:D-amino-acid dehydrogenase